jgi:hypothetical protein
LNTFSGHKLISFANLLFESHPQEFNEIDVKFQKQTDESGNYTVIVANGGAFAYDVGVDLTSIIKKIQDRLQLFISGVRYSTLSGQTYGGK